MPRFNAKRITVSAIMIAISAVIYIVCGFIPFLNFSFGGTITIASLLPIIIISYMYGVKWGLFVIIYILYFKSTLVNYARWSGLHTFSS